MFDPPWWACLLIALSLTHLTIISVTIYLHRHQTHRALDLHPAVSHFFRFWIWLTTGMITKQWVAVHRKHHAKTETTEDPHSPQFGGLARVLWGGVLLYFAESRNVATMEKYGHGTPEDWIEINLYTRYSMIGTIILGIVDIVAFGLVQGSLIYVIQMVWIPFWAAGVINGLGHYWGYRNHPVDDASTNLFPIGILIGGEEFHNNHHACPTSAKLSSAWYEFDIGWMYIRLLQASGLARVRRIATAPEFCLSKTQCDADTVTSIITHRYYVLAQYTRAVGGICRKQVARVHSNAALDPRGATHRQELDSLSRKKLLRWLRFHTWDRQSHRRIDLDAVLQSDALLHVIYSMRQELCELWRPSSASTDQLLTQLGDWRARADASGIVALQEFAASLPHLNCVRCASVEVAQRSAQSSQLVAGVRHL